jgi:molecular chaperone IbpA
MVMDRFDFSPLFRSTIGFDRLARLVDAATHVDSSALSYPPYNIEKVGEDAYRLTMAVAGFSRDEIDIVVQENTLFVTGKAQKEDENGRYLHRGIARRAFERRFSLADHIKVTGASLDNGLLHRRTPFSSINVRTHVEGQGVGGTRSGWMLGATSVLPLL